MRRLQKEGVISGVSLHVMPEKVNLSGVAEYDDFLDIYERMEQWAEKHGVRLTPGFSELSTTSEVWGETRRVLRTPMMCILLYWGSKIVGVFPHTSDETHHAVDEALAVLESGEIAAILPDPTRFPPTTGNVCPECDGTLVNTQGALCCYECHWDEITARESSSQRDPTRLVNAGLDN
jgi:hypothetical protein